jgi:hypothetical protein
MAKGRRRPRVPLRECLICENRIDTRPSCWLCGGLGWIPQRTFNRYKLGEIKKDEWLGTPPTPAPPIARDWITVRFSGGPHHGEQMIWSADDPPEVGQELEIPADADLRLGTPTQQDALFPDFVRYVIDYGPAGFRAVHRPGRGHRGLG